MGAVTVVATVLHDAGRTVEHRQRIFGRSHPSWRPQPQHTCWNSQRGSGLGDVDRNRLGIFGWLFRRPFGPVGLEPCTRSGFDHHPLATSGGCHVCHTRKRTRRRQQPLGRSVDSTHHCAAGKSRQLAGSSPSMDVGPTRRHVDTMRPPIQSI